MRSNILGLVNSSAEWIFHKESRPSCCLFTGRSSMINGSLVRSKDIFFTSDGLKPLVWWLTLNSKPSLACVESVPVRFSHGQNSFARRSRWFLGFPFPKNAQECLLRRLNPPQGGELWTKILSQGLGSLTPNFCFWSKSPPYHVFPPPSGITLIDA